MAEPDSFIERRKSRRVRINLSVVYRIDRPLVILLMVGDKEIWATTLDLSEEGMAVMTDYDIPISTILMIKFTIFKVTIGEKIELYGPMEITGEVKYNMPMEGNKHRLGINFNEINEKDKTEIGNFIKLLIPNPSEKPK